MLVSAIVACTEDRKKEQGFLKFNRLTEVVNNINLSISVPNQSVLNPSDEIVGTNLYALAVVKYNSEIAGEP
jgi:hypothetical protein